MSSEAIFDKDKQEEGTPTPEEGTPTPEEGTPTPENETKQEETPAVDLPEEVRNAIPEKYEGDFSKFVKGYTELSAAYSKKFDVPDEYDDSIVPESIDLGDSKEAVFKEMKEKGFTAPQAEAMFKMYEEHALPVVLEANKKVESMTLAGHWKFDLNDEQQQAKYNEKANEVYGFGVKELGEEKAKLFATSAGGMLFMEQLMQAKANSERVAVNSTTQANKTDVITPDTMDQLVRDKRYSPTLPNGQANPDHDPAWVQKITQQILEAEGKR